MCNQHIYGLTRDVIFFIFSVRVSFCAIHFTQETFVSLLRQGFRPVVDLTEGMSLFCDECDQLLTINQSRDLLELCYALPAEEGTKNGGETST